MLGPIMSHQEDAPPKRTMIHRPSLKTRVAIGELSLVPERLFRNIMTAMVTLVNTAATLETKPFVVSSYATSNEKALTQRIGNLWQHRRPRRCIHQSTGDKLRNEFLPQVQQQIGEQRAKPRPR